jgi:hypothetical protein
MNWEAAGVIAEFLGAAAVLVSLLYLASQVRQSTAVARSDARQGIAEAAMAEATSIIDHSDLASIWYRELSGEAAEGEDDYRLRLFCFRSLRLYENIHYQYRAGMLDADEWSAFPYNLLHLFKTQAYNRSWAGSEPLYTTVFRTLVEELREELRGVGQLGESGLEMMGIDAAEPPGASA